MTPPMLRIGLWNTRGREDADLIGNLAARHNLNVVVLLEAETSEAELLETLFEASGRVWFRPWSLCEHVLLLTSISDRYVTSEREESRFTIRRIALPGLPDVVIGIAHLRSRLHQRDASQLLGIQDFVRAVEEVEELIGHRRTVVLGDFNMDPYDDGMVAAGAMHGMMSRRTASSGSRVINSRKYRMFYNPMWGHLGDRHGGPPGTYRYWSSEHVCKEWHIFDQVLVRRDLLPAFPGDRLQILDRIGGTSLLTVSGLPTPSDHLPIVFEIQEPGAEHDNR